MFVMRIVCSQRLMYLHHWIRAARVYGRRAERKTARLELTVENRDEPDRDHVVPYLRASPAAYPRGCSRRHVLLGEAMIHPAELSGARHRACRWTSLRAHDWPAPKTRWPAAVSRSKRRSGGRDTRGQILLSESNDRRPLALVPPGNATNAPTLLARALVRPDALGRFEKPEPPPPPPMKSTQERGVR